ncbi:HRDC domain-containing protein [Paenibacillus sp. YN15]|uniref:HRDC domain-containing protein n=1 Tax=Paenibacillus sp. YN15 TaxID=1742774 RepID=UPI000DCE061B|nr:HRDC domain-containing protein [Paenibacillus sp. YN15]RAU97600.1 aldolase [Paenibacillus sp. YN15]
MQLIFLSTLECRSEDGSSVTAQVSITEHQGAFRVLWTGESRDGKGGQEDWFEGPAWKDMLQAYREGLWQKRLAGYYPLVDTSLQTSGEGAKSREQLMLQFYAETHHDPELFQELRKWRMQLAQKENKSAYIVATNRMLHMVCAFLPATVEELRQIPGFGKRKAEAYGHELLAITGGREQERMGGFPLNWVYGKVEQREFEAWLVRQLKLKEEQEEQRERVRRLVLEGVEAGLTLKELAEITRLPRRELVLLLEELDQQGYNMEPIVAAELTGMDADKLAAAGELFNKHGSRLLKPVFQEWYTGEELEGQDLGNLYEKLRLLRMRLNHAMAAEAAEGPAPEEPALEEEAG